MTGRRPVFSPEFKEEAVKLVIDSSRPIPDVARQLNIHVNTLRNWLNKYRANHDSEDLSVAERAELRALKREVAELKMKNEFLGKAAAFFAQEYR